MNPWIDSRPHVVKALKDAGWGSDPEHPETTLRHPLGPVLVFRTEDGGCLLDEWNGGTHATALFPMRTRDAVVIAACLATTTRHDTVPNYAGRDDNGQSARADLLNTFAAWFFTTGKGSREAADQILGKHRDEVLHEADETAATEQLASTAPVAAGLPLVKGRCPACWSASLFLGIGGYVTCSRIDCPAPDAASTVLEQFAAGEQR